VFQEDAAVSHAVYITCPRRGCTPDTDSQFR